VPGQLRAAAAGGRAGAEKAAGAVSGSHSNPSHHLPNRWTMPEGRSPCTSLPRERWKGLGDSEANEPAGYIHDDASRARWRREKHTASGAVARGAVSLHNK
jgi:hypothetical protein